MHLHKWWEKLCCITHAAQWYLTFRPYLTVLILRCLAFIKKCSKELWLQVNFNAVCYYAWGVRMICWGIILSLSSLLIWIGTQAMLSWLELYYLHWMSLSVLDHYAATSWNTALLCGKNSYLDVEPSTWSRMHLLFSIDNAFHRMH